MPNVIKLKNSGTANSAPASLEVGELAINYADGKIYYKNASNVVTSFSSTFITTSDTGTVTSTMIANNTVVNADISSAAAISHSKLANATPGQVLLGTTTTGVVTATTVTGDVTITGAGVTAITANSIVNADINTAAAISLSKLATSTAGNIIVYNASGVPTSVAETGDVTISDTGVTAIASNVIVNADINSAAAIAYSKLSLSNSVLNADINSAAAIAHSKLANATPGQVLLGTTTTGVVTATTISGDITINGAGVATIAANSVALGTDTTGNYMTDVSAGTGITITHTPGEGSTATIAVTTNTYQPLDADLTAIGGLSGTSGVLKKTAANTWELDTTTYLTDASTLLMDIQVLQAMEAY